VRLQPFDAITVPNADRFSVELAPMSATALMIEFGCDWRCNFMKKGVTA
jgi:hypothetical protein